MPRPSPAPPAPGAGPYGTWKGGREKAPAAFCRKAITAVGEVEMWGDGKQTRSFTFIDDCVEGILRITKSDFREPLNLGSTEMVGVVWCGWVGVVVVVALLCAYCACASRLYARPRPHPPVLAHPCLPPAPLAPAGEHEPDDGDGDGL